MSVLIGLTILGKPGLRICQPNSTEVLGASLPVAGQTSPARFARWTETRLLRQSRLDTDVADPAVCHRVVGRRGVAHSASLVRALLITGSGMTSGSFVVYTFLLLRLHFLKLS